MAEYTSNKVTKSQKHMFTGIIHEIGKIKNIKKDSHSVTFDVQAIKILKKKKIGDSIAVNGVCVTIVKLNKNIFEFQAVKETLERTNFKELKIGSEVNLEPALALNQSLDGHLVQGHIDNIGIVENLKKDGNKSALTIKFPKELAYYIAFKGSIAINGISLTISDLQESTFSVALIPHTLKNTNIKNLKKGDKVNLEIDLIARYLKNLLDKKENEAKYEFLKERNLI